MPYICMWGYTGVFVLSVCGYTCFFPYLSVCMGTLVFLSYLSMSGYIRVFVIPFSVCEYTGVFVLSLCVWVHWCLCPTFLCVGTLVYLPQTALFVGTRVSALSFCLWIHWCFCPTFLCVGTLLFLSNFLCVSTLVFFPSRFVYGYIFVLPFCVWVHWCFCPTFLCVGTLVFLSHLFICGYTSAFVLPFCVWVHWRFCPNRSVRGYIFVLSLCVWVHWCFCLTFLFVGTLAFLSYFSECGCTCFSSTALCESSLCSLFVIVLPVCVRVHWRFCPTFTCASTLAIVSCFFVYAKSLAFLSYFSVCDYTGVFVPQLLLSILNIFVLPLCVRVHLCFCPTCLCEYTAICPVSV